MGTGITIHDLTPEMREKIGRFIPIPVGNEFKYVPRAFREFPTEHQPVFRLKYLEGTAVMRSQDMLYGRVLTDGAKPEIVVKRGEFVVYVCEQGIIGWDGYFGVEYKNKTSIGKLPPDLLEELCNAITERKSLSDEELLGLK
jgi:hypothetical protein